MKITDSWNNYLDYFTNESKDIYFTEEYVKLYETEVDSAKCFVYNEGSNYLVFPFLRRQFEFKGTIYYDFETAYGYGGPIANTLDLSFISASLKAFFDYCCTHNYVAGFVRFHPLLDNSTCYNKIGKVTLDRETVSIDLNLSEEEIWLQEIKTKNRSTIKKSIKNNLIFIQDSEFQYLPEFIDLYTRTMNKLSADDFYLFDNSYYYKWRENIKDSFLGVVLYKEKIISAAIFFYSKTYGHYHLSGSNVDYLALNPNNFMLWEAAKSMKSLGVKSFHLGGGVNGDPNNSLLEFKSRFSKRRYNFFIGKTIFNNEIYQELCRLWGNNYSEKALLFNNHLLKYKY